MPRVVQAIEVDGVADEEAWSRAGELVGFTVYQPDTGIEQTFEASARVLSRTDALYFFVEIGVAEDAVHAPLGQRDSFPPGDSVEVRIDPYDRGIRGYGFEVNAAGVLSDGILRDRGGYDAAWDSLFDARTSIGPDGWAAEIRVPFQSLRFDAAQDSWGVHVFVHGWWAEQSVSWAPIDRERQNRLAQAGTLTGMAGNVPGRAVEILPSLTVASTRDGDPEAARDCAFEADVFETGRCATELDYGVGLKWGATPWLTLDVVWNPDFSQVEADPAQLRLNNRFPLFLGERRPFFLEGRDIFEAPRSAVYTRSINRPHVATKVSGQLPNGRFGSLVAYDIDPPDSVVDPGFDPSAFPGAFETVTTVNRALWDAHDDLTLGVSGVTRNWVGNPERTAANYVVAVEADAEPANGLSTEASVALSHSRSLDGEELDGISGEAFVQYRTDTWRTFARYDAISDGFRAESGFVRRVGFHAGALKLDYYYRSDRRGLQHISPGVLASAVVDGYGEVVDRTISPNVYWDFGRHTAMFHEYERVGERYEGRWFDMDAYHLWAGTSAVEWLSVSGGLTLRDTIVRDEALRDEGEAAFMGAQVAPNASLTLRPHASLAWTPSWRQRWVGRSLFGDELASQPIARSTLQYFLRRDLDLRYIIEWDQFDESLSNDVLLSWKPSPGTVLFLGYREATSFEGERHLGERSGFAKFSWLWSL